MLEEYDLDSEEVQEILDNRSIKYGFEFDRASKIAMDRAEMQCESCGMGHRESREKHNSPLTRHHTTPVREFETDREAHTPENIRILCPPCHINAEWGAHTTDHEPESQLEWQVIELVESSDRPLTDVDIIETLEENENEIRGAISRMISGGYLSLTPDAEIELE